MGGTGSYHLRVVVPEDDDGACWDAFLTNLPGVPYHQSSLWARVKAGQGWRSALMTVTRDGAIHGGAQLLYRSIPLAGAIGFVPRGPVLASNDPTLAAAAAVGLERLARAFNVTYLIVQPPKECADVLTPQLLRNGYRTAPEIMAPHESTTRLLDLSQGEATILAGMRSSTRRNVRLAQRRGISVREGGAADLPAFSSLLAATSQRRGLSWPQASFFDAAWTTMAPAGMLRMAVAEFDREPVSVFLWLVLGDTMNCWIGAWSGEHRYRRPNEALDWSGIRWAAGHGLRWYDFQGDSRLRARVRWIKRDVPRAARAGSESAAAPAVPEVAPQNARYPGRVTVEAGGPCTWLAWLAEVHGVSGHRVAGVGIERGLVSIRPDPVAGP